MLKECRATHRTIIQPSKVLEPKRHGIGDAHAFTLLVQILLPTAAFACRHALDPFGVGVEAVTPLLSCVPFGTLPFAMALELLGVPPGIFAAVTGETEWFDLVLSVLLVTWTGEGHGCTCQGKNCRKKSLEMHDM